MELYANGDARAFDELFARISPRVYGFLSRKDRGAADDLLQLTFLKLHAARETYRPGAPVLPWVLTIASRVFLDHARAHRRARTDPADPEALAAVPAPEADGPHPRAEELAAAVAELPEQQRQVVLQHKYEDKSLAEVAASQKSTVTAVKLRAHRAYQALRKKLGKDE